jgi:hypothetical protein
MWRLARGVAAALLVWVVWVAQSLQRLKTLLGVQGPATCRPCGGGGAAHDAVVCIDAHEFDADITGRRRTRTWLAWAAAVWAAPLPLRPPHLHAAAAPARLREYTLLRRSRSLRRVERLLTFADAPPPTLRAAPTPRTLLDAHLAGADVDISGYLNERLHSFGADAVAVTTTTTTTPLTLTLLLRAMRASGRLTSGQHAAAVRAGPVLRVLDTDLAGREVRADEPVRW